MLRSTLTLAASLLALAGCQSTPRLDAAQARGSNQPPLQAAARDSQLARFRAGLPAVDHLSGGAASREELASRFLEALTARDTTTLRRLVLTKAEFAWLYYPTAREALPPYDLDPELMWFAHEGRSESGIRAALEVLAGRGDTYLGLDCPVPARQEGRNSLWGFCRIRHRVPAGAESADQLFGLIIERDGIYKVVSYANKLD